MSFCAVASAQMSARDFFVLSSDGDTIALSGIAVVSKKTVLKKTTVMGCEIILATKKTKKIKDTYYNDESHFMTYLSVGDTVDFYYASGEKFEYDVIRIRTCEGAMFWFDVPKTGEARVLRAERGYLLLNNGTIVKENKRNVQYAVGDVVHFVKTAKPFIVKLKNV